MRWKAKKKKQHVVGSYGCKKKDKKTRQPLKSVLTPQKNGGKVQSNVATPLAAKNEQGCVVYSKFDFAASSLANKRKFDDPENKKVEKRKKQFGGKDYKSLLEKVEKQENKLQELKEKNPEKAAVLEESRKWEKALEKTEGVKIKDDKKMLKMNVKKKEKLKQKTKEGWELRQANVGAKMEKKQDKRMSNIQKRKDDKQKRKIDKARKKGRFVLPPK